MAHNSKAENSNVPDADNRQENRVWYRPPACARSDSRRASASASRWRGAYAVRKERCRHPSGAEYRHFARSTYGSQRASRFCRFAGFRFPSYSIVPSLFAGHRHESFGCSGRPLLRCAFSVVEGHARPAVLFAVFFSSGYCARYYSAAASSACCSPKYPIQSIVISSNCSASPTKASTSALTASQIVSASAS